MKKKIAVVHPRLLAGGGSESCCLWIVEALKDDYDVTLITMGDASLSVFNTSFNTNFQEGQIKLISLPIPWFFKKKFDALRQHRLVRFCKKIAPEFDVMISTYNVMDFGKRGMQYIVDLSFSDELRREYDPEPSKSLQWLYKKSFLRSGYMAFALMLSGNSPESWKKNCTLVVSNWIGGTMHKAYGIKPYLLYPPIFAKAQNISWGQRENGFLYLGRVSPEKQIEKIIQIVKEARKNHPDLHLHIIGRTDPVNVAYGDMIKELCRQNSNWCFMEGAMYGQKKLDFIAKHKYALSARANEASGLAIFEMVKSGCIAFVPNGGGQTEILNDNFLIYDSVEDAVKKISLVVGDEAMQDRLRQHLVKESEKFSIENFKKETKELVSLFLQNKI